MVTIPDHQNILFEKIQLEVSSLKFQSCNLDLSEVESEKWKWRNAILTFGKVIILFFNVGDILFDERWHYSQFILFNLLFFWELTVKHKYCVLMIISKSFPFLKLCDGETLNNSFWIWNKHFVIENFINWVAIGNPEVQCNWEIFRVIPGLERYIPILLQIIVLWVLKWSRFPYLWYVLLNNPFALRLVNELILYVSFFKVVDILL
jgi:hypothetical protein